jgi:ribosomal protein S18 acetylase RimI-like enzyme
MQIEYFVNKHVSTEQFIGLLQSTTLGTRRPIDNLERIQGMLDNSNLIVTAWNGSILVGISRSVTDFHYCCYLSDLAVSESYQSKGIGKELIRMTSLELKPECQIILLAAPLAKEYYQKVGFIKHESAWTKLN